MVEVYGTDDKSTIIIEMKDGNDSKAFQVKVQLTSPVLNHPRIFMQPLFSPRPRIQLGDTTERGTISNNTSCGRVSITSVV